MGIIAIPLCFDIAHIAAIQNTYINQLKTNEGNDVSIMYYIRQTYYHKFLLSHFAAVNYHSIPFFIDKWFGIKSYILAAQWKFIFALIFFVSLFFIRSKIIKLAFMLLIIALLGLAIVQMFIMKSVNIIYYYQFGGEQGVPWNMIIIYFFMGLGLIVIFFIKVFLSWFFKNKLRKQQYQKINEKIAHNSRNSLLNDFKNPISPSLKPNDSPNNQQSLKKKISHNDKV